MHQIRITNQPCDGDATRVTANVIDVTGATTGHQQALVREVQLAVGESTALLLPAGSTIVIREQTHGQG